MERKKPSPSSLKKHRWRRSGLYLWLVWKTWERAEFILCLGVLSLLHTYQRVTRDRLLAVFTMVHQHYMQDGENGPDVKRWAAHQSRLFYGRSAGHNEHRTPLLLKTKLSAPNGARRGDGVPGMIGGLIGDSSGKSQVYILWGTSMCFM